jgi:ADP-ribose pyrophosphatase YjhB (NUDIX family)
MGQVVEPIVVSCLIERGAGETLIVTRGADGVDREWEFPTGRAKDDESPEAAMRRVAMETLRVRIDVHTGQPPIRGDFEGVPSTYRFYLVMILDGEPTPRGYAECRWVEKGRLSEYDFAPPHDAVADWYTSS